MCFRISKELDRPTKGPRLGVSLTLPPVSICAASENAYGRFGCASDRQLGGMRRMQEHFALRSECGLRCNLVRGTGTHPFTIIT